MDFQFGFNVVLSVCGFLMGYILKTLTESLKSLQKADNDLTLKVQAIEVLVAGKYVTKDDLGKMGQDLFTMLHRIEDKLDGKMDKTK